jgi:hypothetical protein
MAHRYAPLVQSRTCQLEPFANREPVRDDMEKFVVRLFDVINQAET